MDLLRARGLPPTALRLGVLPGFSGCCSTGHDEDLIRDQAGVREQQTKYAPSVVVWLLNVRRGHAAGIASIGGTLVSHFRPSHAFDLAEFATAPKRPAVSASRESASRRAYTARDQRF
ncbi:hypothetical protein FAF44_00985 [Nonomuraea sp. MG754425]|uniref:hypothetical protein n=1 Tax=Nonomuraea sp. MG754425 TaxID=2570319 RepID=UPI001F21F87F|nr:hypothetical protein [Nonomuraea sp. MG754425]MCF6466988.1 hypothetical protein [Nonomuraea sp. MG754425]